MTKFFKTILSLFLIAAVGLSTLTCCCLSNAAASEMPEMASNLPPCHQAAQKTSDTTDHSQKKECDCEQSLAILGDKADVIAIQPVLLTAAVIPEKSQTFSLSHNPITPQTYYSPPGSDSVPLYIKYSVFRI